jgi:pentatricopeptide repeat protein
LVALDKFDDFKVEILPESISTLVGCIGQSTQSLDSAYDALLSLPRPVNIEAINATLRAAAVNLSDLPRAIGIYKDISTFEATPNTQTFNVLLAGCLKASHRALGERLYSDMLALGLEPTIQTYTRLILLSLTEVEYESAFVRLEEMKEKMMTPPLRVYEALVKRLVKERDPRADLALEDMEVCGYRVSPSLKQFLLGKPDEEGEREERGERRQIYRDERPVRRPVGART